MKSTMLIKPDQSSPSAAAAAAAPTTCGNCGVEERRLLHHVRHRGVFRRLCTTCVLRLHPQSFCPTCFAVYHPSPPPSGPNDAVTCIKCYSSSHSRCVGPNSPNPYICPNCVNPNSPIFALKKAKDLGIESSEAVSGNNAGDCRVIDKKAAKILLAAARIAAVSMSKAAVAARAEAERRAKEAAFTRKRAREALEHVAYLVAKEKLKKKEAAVTAVVTAANEAFGVACRGGGRAVVASVRGNNSNRNVGSANIGVGVVREQRRVGNMERVNGSNDVLAALNAVGLREGKKSGELKVDNVESGDPVIDVVPMDVEENGRVEVYTGLNDGRAVVETSGNVDHLENRGGRVGDNVVSNGDAVVLPAEEDQVQPMGRSVPMQQDNNGSGH
ncbi:hypothetical protein ACH5RR_022768 [Cinchona calisaya]|uniref:Uncharacterized protein n=1 Tax=Cinchona calisaya TaxID=153742 RepID=A0ABD2Z8Q7_9GENT